MLYRLRRAMQIREFDRRIKGIMETPPMRIVDAPWSIVSMVATRDLPMYLLAMKSFYRRIGRGRLVAIIDRDTPDAARAVLSEHFKGIEFKVLEDIDTGICQRGGTWERLVYILDRAADEYVIQVDADTLSLADLPEVVRCAEQNLAFTMADDAQRRTMREEAAMAKQTDGNYIGTVAERLFDRYPDCDNQFYIRGSSGLAGFAKGGFGRSRIEEFHMQMERLLGEADWRRWGSEQCGSNFAVANSPNPVVLPFPDYASYNPNSLRPDTRFFHFIGTYRFAKGFFAARGRDVIRGLQNA